MHGTRCQGAVMGGMTPREIIRDAIEADGLYSGDCADVVLAELERHGYVVVELETLRPRDVDMPEGRSDQWVAQLGKPRGA